MSDLALQLIAENKRTKQTFLDLGNCGLTEVPDEVGELVWIECLSLAHEWYEFDGRSRCLKVSHNRGDRNRLTAIGPLRRLNRLRSLHLSRAQVTDLAPLAGLSALQSLELRDTQVTDIGPLSSLSALQSLDLRETQVADITPLAGFSALQSLDLRDTQVSDTAALAGLSALRSLSLSGTQVSDIAPLAGLSALQSLFLSLTAVADVAPLAGLSALQSLILSWTQVADIAPLADLSALRVLDVSGTQVADLSALKPAITRGIPVLWTSMEFESYGIFVMDCPLTSPPPEIARQGNEAILNYFRERAKAGIDHLYEAKLLILGEGGAGKTSLLRRLYQPELPLPSEKETTKGIFIHRHDFPLKNGMRFRLNVWDFGGQQIYHATHQLFLTQRSLYLLVDDTKTSSKSVSDEGFKYWLELVSSFGGNSPVLIFQNEKGDRSKAIDMPGIKSRFDNVRASYAGNLERTDAADRLREAIEFFASNLSHIGEELPARWVQVRRNIEERAADVPYISQQEYFEIYSRHMEFDRTKALHLSRYLHDLGVFLHFQDDPLLARTVILQNEWATEAVFRILDDETVKAQHGQFQAGDCARIWRDSVYRDMHPELLALMRKFELCYKLVDITPTTWLATQLLSASKPTGLVDWAKPEDLVLRYQYDFLPKGIISRLTVRLHRFVLNPEMAWVTGVLFQSEQTEALTQLMANGREIELRGRGPQRKSLLSLIAADLDALNASFQGLRDKVDKRIPCNCTKCGTVFEPQFFSEKYLLRRKEDHRLKVECPASYEEVSVLELLDGISVDPPSSDTKPALAARREIRIFLASSAELREDRDQFDLYFRQQNDLLQKKGLYLKIERWENFLDAMSETRLQDEYNKAIRTCDVFVSLFFTKTGKFTAEEFEVAHRQFKATGKPRIYTFFKDAPITTGRAAKEDLQSLWAFQEKLNELGHFWTLYTSTEHLKREFRDQLDRIVDLP